MKILLNYEKEILIMHNLTPLHVFSEKFLPEVAKDFADQEQFFRKGENRNWAIVKFLIK